MWRPYEPSDFCSVLGLGRARNKRAAFLAKASSEAPMLTLAHLSDLHFGERSEHVHVAKALVKSLLEQKVDHVVVTGDVTHSGTISEYQQWLTIFEPLLSAKKMTVVP